MLFAEKLKELRITKGMSQKQLAELAGTNQQTIGRWEAGEMTPAFDAVLSLCRALGVRCTTFEGCEFAEINEKPGRGRPPKEADEESSKKEKESKTKKPK